MKANSQWISVISFIKHVGCWWRNSLKQPGGFMRPPSVSNDDSASPPLANQSVFASSEHLELVFISSANGSPRREPRGAEDWSHSLSNWEGSESVEQRCGRARAICCFLSSFFSSFLFFFHAPASEVTGLRPLLFVQRWICLYWGLGWIKKK